MATPNKKRSNHFLPICYQKGFTNPDGLVWVQFLNKEKPPVSLNPISVGKIHKFYTRYTNGLEDDSVETFFQINVEDLYAPIARRIKAEASAFTMEDDDIPILLRFVAAQIVRTQAHKRCIDEQAGIPLGPDVFFHNMGRKMKKIFDAWLRKFPNILLHTPLPVIGSHFITGDNPVVSVTGNVDFKGIETPFDSLTIVNIDKILEDASSEFTLPMSPYVCLTVVNRGTGQIFRSPQSLEPVWVSRINQRIYGQCVQFVEAMDARSLSFHERRASSSGILVATSCDASGI